MMKKLKLYIGYYDDDRIGAVLSHSADEAAKAVQVSFRKFKTNWRRRPDLPDFLMLTNRLYTRPKSPLVDVPWTLGVVEIKEDADAEHKD